MSQTEIQYRACCPNCMEPLESLTEGMATCDQCKEPLVIISLSGMADVSEAVKIVDMVALGLGKDLQKKKISTKKKGERTWLILHLE